METKIYGYIRDSSQEKNEDCQLIAMAEAGVPRENIYMDKQSRSYIPFTDEIQWINCEFISYN